MDLPHQARVTQTFYGRCLTMKTSTEHKLFHTDIESLMDVVYEEERAIELMLRAHASGDQSRVSELNDYILILRSQSGMSQTTSEQG